MLILLLAVPLFASYVKVPGLYWGYQGFYHVGPLAVGREGSIPYYALRLEVSITSSGSCSFGWWRDLLNVPRAWSLGINGKGVRVLVIDSGADDKVLRQVFGRGVDYFFNAAYEVYKNSCISYMTINFTKYCIIANQTQDWYNIYYAVPTNQTAFDQLGHGTAVSSVILSIAPNVTLYVANIVIDVIVTDKSGKVYQVEPIIVDPLALNWALRYAVRGPDMIENTSDDAQVVNLSLAAYYYPLPPFISSYTTLNNLLLYFLMVQPIEEASKTVAFVAADGNEPLGIPPVPAGLEGVISVSALVYNGTFELASFSNYNSVDFSSIGSGLYLPLPKNSYLAKLLVDYSCGRVEGNAYWARMDGTSFSTPMVSGVAALWVQLTGAKGTSQVRCLLKSNALDVLSPGYDPQSGWGVPLAPSRYERPCEAGKPVLAISPLLLIALLRRRR